MSPARGKLVLLGMALHASLACASAAPPPFGELGGGAWTLVAFDAGAPAAGAAGITLVIEEARISGKSACNRYFAPIEPGTEPGAVGFGAIGATRRMCPQAEMALEARFLSALRHVVAYSVEGGELRLVSDDDGVVSRLSFAR